MPSSQPDQAKAVRRKASQPAVVARSVPPEASDFSIIGIGASAGGLDACTRLLDALPAGNGMTFILIQHLDSTHESMMVELLASHTTMAVLQAADGMPIEPDHVYVIPPGTYLAAIDGVLRLKPPQARHGARLPFDFLLRSLAGQYGVRAACVVLLGTGADGSIGLKAIKDRSGLVIAQALDEAGYDSMPRSAIMTGAVDLVLPVADIPAALVGHDRRRALLRVDAPPPPQDAPQDWLPEVLGLIRAHTVHDFLPYKPGTLQRRIERHMALASIRTDAMGRYLAMLRSDPGELDRLAKDLLINVTSFFRDPKVFECLSETVIPGLVRNRAPDSHLRVWIARCSTGEEAYSLAMLFRERITAAKCNVKLQVFASDVDPDAVAVAQECRYPETIAANISKERLARFFTRKDHGYKVSPELRAAVVFTVQDLLIDPPFSRLDFISCRNLLIYLGAEAQAKAIALFDFALVPDGVLLLGSSETVGDRDRCFEVFSKAERLYRHLGRDRSNGVNFTMGAGNGVRRPPGLGQRKILARQAILADLCRRLVMDIHAPAAMLCSRDHECLYSLGPTERYLRVAPGHPTHDLLAMVHESVRAKLCSAIQQAIGGNVRVVVAGGRTVHNAHPVPFSRRADDMHPILGLGHGCGNRAAVDPVDQGPQQRVACHHERRERSRLWIKPASRERLDRSGTPKRRRRPSDTAASQARRMQ